MRAPTAQTVLNVLTLTLVAAALLLGGATREGDIPNAIVRLLSIPVLVLALGRLMEHRPEREAGLLMLLTAAVIAVPVIELIPLPPALWTALPGRAPVAEAYAAAGMAAPWLPVSLSPDGTVNAALALLPGAAAFFAALTLDKHARRAVVPWVLAAAAASMVLGVAQLAGGQESDLRFYEITNASAAVGFFANRNHQAALLLAAMPLIVAWMRHANRRGNSRRPLVLGLSLGFIAALTAAVITTDSRAGQLLLIPVGLGCILMALGVRLPRISLRLALGAVVALVLAAGLAVQFGLLQSAADVPLEGELRLRVAPTIAQASMHYLPFGSGPGTFDPIYRMYETVRTNAFLNHAHNDYLELWLETGVFALILIPLFLAWFITAGLRAWRSGEGDDLARAATIIIALLLVHSLVDYPLRTAAMSVLFAFACGCLIKPQVKPEQAPAEIRHGHRRPHLRAVPKD